MAKGLNPWKIQGYKPGQNVICKIVRAEPGGYSVVIPKDDLPGFLPSQAHHNVGAEVLAQFVCVDKNRMLLSERFTASNSPAPKETGSARVNTVNWQEQLEELDNVYATGKHSPVDDQSAQATAQAAAQTHVHGQNTMPVESTPVVEATPEVAPEAAPPDQEQYQTSGHPSQQDMAFHVYASNVPQRKYQLRRAIDLIMPPIDEDSLKSIRIGDYDVEWLITDLEGGMRTGCVKATCESRLSRAAMLLYRGRAVGCIYGCKSDPDTKPTDESLNMMLADLESPDTQVTLYDLPENITLSMSSLFLGYPVKREDDYSAREYMDYICDWFETETGTATLAISLSEGRGMCLGYIYKGQFCGAFYVEDQVFREDKEFVHELLASDANADLGVSILPPEMTSTAVRFGYSLSMARKNRTE